MGEQEILQYKSEFLNQNSVHFTDTGKGKIFSTITHTGPTGYFHKKSPQDSCDPQSGTQLGFGPGGRGEGVLCYMYTNPMMSEALLDSNKALLIARDKIV